jgi:hypothetical protein
VLKPHRNMIISVLLILVTVSLLAISCENTITPSVSHSLPPTSNVSKSSTPTVTNTNPTLNISTKPVPQIIAKISLADQLNNEKSPNKNILVILTNTTTDFLAVKYKATQHDEKGNFVQDMPMNDVSIPPGITLMTGSLGTFAKSNEQINKEWNISILGTNKLSPAYTQKTFGYVLGCPISVNNISTQTITNINGVPEIYMDGSLGNSDPPASATPKNVLLQIFNKDDSNNLTLVCNTQDIKPLPPPQEKTNLHVKLMRNIDILESKMALIKGIITIVPYYY